MLKVAEIINDKSYLEHESNLEENLRIKTGRYRFHYLSADIDMDSPEEVIRIAPPQILSMPIEDIELSVHSYNVLSRKGIIFVRDIAEYTNAQLMGMEHLGRKSVFDIAMSIRTAIGELPNGIGFVRSQHKKGSNTSDQQQTKPLDRRGRLTRPLQSRQHSRRPSWHY